MNIYSSSDSLILAVTVDDNSYRNRQIMGDHNLTLYYSLAEHTEIPVGSYVEYQGVRYTLDRPEAFKMKHRRLFEYTVTFEAYQSRAKRWKFRNTVDGRLKFPLTATPREHLQMFVDNMNRRDSGWTIGSCITGVEHLVNYDNNYCIEALQAMAEEFGTEFEISGKTVSLHKVEYNKSNPLPLSYGRGNGFKPNVGRSNSGDAMPVEILFAVGGEDNIDPHAYGNRSLLLPEGGTIGFDGVHFSDEAGFDATNARYYAVSEDRLSIQRSDKELSSQAEDSLDCTDIYPKRVGTVGQVIVVDADNHFYDFTDTNPAADPCPDYEECLIAGETMTVRFQSGMLAGREFEVKYNHNPKTEKGVQKLGRRFEIVPQEIDGVTMPDATFKPAAGDTYAVFHCAMPTEYTAKAEADMFRAAVRYMYEHEDQRFSFTGELDGIWAKKDWTNIGGRIVLGGYIRFTDESFQTDPVLVRITGIKDYINNPHSPEITLSNETITGGFSSEFKRVQAEEVAVDENYRRGTQFTKRRFRDAQETMKMIEQALIEGYSQSISPIAAQMLQLLVGDESLQYRFVTSHTAANPTVVTPVFAFDSDTGIFTVTGGYYLQHLTIGVQMKASHAVSEYKWWTVQAYTSAVLDDPDKRYYLFLKCPIEGGVQCQYILSQTAIKMTAAAGYYHFLVGVLNSEYEGERSFASLYGFTEITGGRITTDKIVSSDGNTYFDLAGSEIGGRIVFTNRNGQTITLLQLDERLGKWASDSYVSPEEKTALRQVKSNIEQEYIAVCADADRYSVIKTEYTTAYNSAITALNKYTTATPENIAVDSDYANIAAYYTARKTILEAIATAAKSYADGKVSEAKSTLEKAIAEGDTATYDAAVEEIEAFGRTIISGGYIKTDLINVDELVVKNVYSKNGKFQLLADGTMKAVNGEFSGKITATSGSIDGLQVQRLRNPFGKITDSFTPINKDNVVSDILGGGSIRYAYSLDWTTASSGRRQTIIGAVSITAPSGKYFYENGRKYTSFESSYECSEMIGYGTEDEFYGWIVVTRTLFSTNYNFGREITPLAFGKVTGTSSGASFAQCKFTNKDDAKVGTNKVMDITRVGEGCYWLYVPRSWFVSADYIYADLCGYGYCYGGSSPIKATVTNIAATTLSGYNVWRIEISTSDDASENDGSFFFKLFNMAQWED